jgi:hypothetical protein
MRYGLGLTGFAPVLLQVCDEQCQEVDCSDANVLNSIVQKDTQGRSYFEQRGAWKEGENFPFVMEFSAKGVHQEDMTERNKLPQGAAASDFIEAEEVHESTVET